MQSLQPQLRQAFESPQKSDEKKVAAVAGQGFCTCDKHICDFCMSGETDQSAQVRSTGITAHRFLDSNLSVNSEMHNFRIPIISADVPVEKIWNIFGPKTVVFGVGWSV